MPTVDAIRDHVPGEEPAAVANRRRTGWSRNPAAALLTYRGNPHSGGQGVYVRHLALERAAWSASASPVR